MSEEIDMKTFLMYMHMDSFKNYVRIQNADECGCFHCRKTFKSSEITDWVDDSVSTARCPFCGMDSVITLNYPFMDTEEIKQFILDEMHKEFFSEDTD